METLGKASVQSTEKQLKLQKIHSMMWANIAQYHTHWSKEYIEGLTERQLIANTHPLDRLDFINQLQIIKNR